MDKIRNSKYYRIAASGSSEINHPAMVILKGLAGKASSVLDLGCGEGTRLNLLTPHKGTGIDISPKAISLARSKYPRLHFLVGDLKKLPFKKKFDLIYSAYVFEHLESPEKVIAEAIKALDKKGKLVIIAPNYGAPNRASPPFKGNRLFKLLKGFLRDYFKVKGLGWNAVEPIATAKNYDIDWDTESEPYLKTLIDYLELRGLKIIYADSCWSEELPESGRMQKIFRLLGSYGVFPFKWWGPHLIVVAEKLGGVEKCVFCKKKVFQKLFKIGFSTIEACTNCGLIRTDGLITADYKNYHRDKDYIGSEKHFKNIFGRVYQDVFKIIKNPGKVLEIGCSTGVLLKIFKDHDWETWGVEPSGAGEVAAKRGIKIINRIFEEASLPKSYFDLVVLNHTLEHFENPSAVIKQVYSLLAPHGKIFIAVPNAGSLSANFMGKRWPYVLPYEHRYHFYPLILKKMLEKSGFEVVFEKSRSGIFTLSKPFSGLLSELTHLKKNFISDFLDIPGAAVSTFINRGTNLTIIAKKIS